MRTREDKCALNLSQHLSEVSASLPPLPSEGSGEATLRDILTELEKPGRDPRGEVEVFEFDKNVHTLSDLIIGMELPGIVTNITNFGAFVDIGVHQDDSSTSLNSPTASSPTPHKSSAFISTSASVSSKSICTANVSG